MRLPSTIWAAGALLAATASPLTVAKADHRYVGEHPIPRGEDGRFCYIQFPHTHVYAPENPEVAYRPHFGGHYFFIGDPVAHGYEGRREAYYGAHPIYVAESVAGVDARDDLLDWCYLEGPHFHIHAPPPRAQFETHGGLHWYMGVYPNEFEEARPAGARINTVYKRMTYSRPVVSVKPPSAYVDVFANGLGIRAAAAGPDVSVTGRTNSGAVDRATVRLRVPTPAVAVSLGSGDHLHSGHVSHPHTHRYRRPKYKKRKKRGKHKHRRKDKRHKHHKRGRKK